MLGTFRDCCGKINKTHSHHLMLGGEVGRLASVHRRPSGLIWWLFFMSPQDEIEFGYIEAPHKGFPVVLDSPRDGNLKDFPVKQLLVRC